MSETASGVGVKGDSLKGTWVAIPTWDESHIDRCEGRSGQ